MKEVKLYQISLKELADGARKVVSGADVNDTVRLAARLSPGGIGIKVIVGCDVDVREAALCVLVEAGLLPVMPYSGMDFDMGLVEVCCNSVDRFRTTVGKQLCGPFEVRVQQEGQNAIQRKYGDPRSANVLACEPECECPELDVEVAQAACNGECESECKEEA